MAGVQGWSGHVHDMPWLLMAGGHGWTQLAMCGTGLLEMDRQTLQAGYAGQTWMTMAFCNYLADWL